MRKILLTLFAWILWFWCFSNFWFWDVISNQNCWTNAWQVCYNDDFVFLRFWNNSPSLNNWDTISFSSNSVMKTSYPQYYKCYDSSDNLIYDWTSIWNSWQPLLFFKVNWYCQWFGSFSDKVNFYDFSSVLTCPLCPTCPEVDTWSILSWYILESEIDTNYCVWNWYCPNECWSWTDFSGDLAFSNLYINNILHPWKENIFVDIPDYITWDYSTDTWSFNLYVWSWYDVDYINSIIDINSYRPDSDDFTNIFVSWLTLIFPYIVVLLFVVFVWKMLKRIFK